MKCAGHFYESFKKDEIDQEVTANAWKNLGFNDQKLGTVMAFQEGVTTIERKLAMITKNENMAICHLCHKNEETITHVLSDCSERRGDYIKRYDIVGMIIYQAILKKCELIKTKMSESITINCEKYSIIWNQQVIKKQKGS